MEKPFSVAFDVLERLPGVDNRIALAGHSFGGYVVSRVAIFEKRVKALVPSSPLIDINRAQRIMLNKIKIPLCILAWLTEIKMKRSPDEVDDVLSDVEQWICGSIFSERGIQCSTHRGSGQVVFAG